MWNVFFGFEPKILQSLTVERLLRDRKQQPTWRAVLRMKAHNIPHLMRSGLSWSSGNIQVGEDRIYLHGGLKGNQSELGRCYASKWSWKFHEGRFLHERRYFLPDLGPDLQWHAKLSVFAPEPSTITNFDLGSIDVETVVWAFAKDWCGQTVYDTRNGTHEAFNTVYPHMPLNGEWPWPKAPEPESDGNEKGREAKDGGLA